MFATLPDFTPRDSHSLWYTSSRAPILSGLPDGPNAHDAHHRGPHGHHPQRQRGQHLLERTALARLAADEAHLHRRRINVQNYGSTWLKPPGIPKTLHQMREEKREQEEHQEAMRREQLANELAEAEAEAAAAANGEDADEGMDDVQLDGAQDLDEEIPDADDEFALGGSDSEDDDDDDGSEDDNQEGEEVGEEALREERQNDLMAARMRMTDDAFREALVRGDPDGDDMYGGGEELVEEGQGHMLDEEDFAQSGNVLGMDDDDADLGMDANLDDDVPEAEDHFGGYEHTDSDAALSSSEREDSDEDGVDDDIGFAPRAAPLGPPQSPTGMRGQHVQQRETQQQQQQQQQQAPTQTMHRARRSTGARSSMDLSAFLSQDESSFMDSSPVQGRRNMRG